MTIPNAHPDRLSEPDEVADAFFLRMVENNSDLADVVRMADVGLPINDPPAPVPIQERRAFSDPTTGITHLYSRDATFGGSDAKVHPVQGRVIHDKDGKVSLHFRVGAIYTTNPNHLRDLINTLQSILRDATAASLNPDDPDPAPVAA